MIHEFIRLTAVSFSSDNCQTKEQQLPDESSTTVRRINLGNYIQSYSLTLVKI